MAYNFTSFKEKISGITDWLSKELANIRTGQATVMLLDSVLVESYGTRSPINQNASVNIEDAKTIRITPWDKSLVKEIEKAITLADLGVSTVVDGEGVRVIFPALTTESRQRLVKQAKTKVEEAKVSVRNERNKVAKQIEESQKAGELPEDDAKRAKDEMQKIVDESTNIFESKAKVKETEILG